MAKKGKWEMGWKIEIDRSALMHGIMIAGFMGIGLLAITALRAWIGTVEWSDELPGICGVAVASGLMYAVGRTEGRKDAEKKEQPDV